MCPLVTLAIALAISRVSELFGRMTMGHLEKYSLEAGRSAIEVAAVPV
jgi:hypothetical protein